MDPFLILLYHLSMTAVLSHDILSDYEGRCSTKSPFYVTSGKEIEVQSSNFAHDNQTLDCRLPFQTSAGRGICIHFEKFFIDDCSVSLRIYEGIGENSERLWYTFRCKDPKPGRICTLHQNITVRILKTRPDPYTGFGFDIRINENGAPTEHGGAFDTYGFVIGIIIAVIVLLVILALILCCCCPSETVATSATSLFVSKTKPHYESYSLPSADQAWEHRQ